MEKVGYIYWLFVQNYCDECKPFVENNLPSDEYCWSMQEYGAWAGHFKLQEISFITQTHIHIHQVFSLFACI